jgi:hypothetical protein
VGVGEVGLEPERLAIAPGCLLAPPAPGEDDTHVVAICHGFGPEPDRLTKFLDRFIEPAEGEQGRAALPVDVGVLGVGGEGLGDELERGLVLALPMGRAGLFEQVSRGTGGAVWGAVHDSGWES